ncbi:hypothetical protein [Pseudoxanthomonas koreensis]|uniref:hypothetical protein n=1 Tax=Pseudoxanthomonas koreensis TaxID=266061 RepID=UPI001391755B|nr:hypothetical protein [Pseudoxanthomonas koreensis]KAF1689682.1 hypothetical protein CSC64_12410 [Pseudoxanthomonas koreensis]
MPRILTASTLLALALLAPAAIAQEGDATAALSAPTGDLSALLECRAGRADFMAYIPVLRDPLKAIALGWRPLPQANPFMIEYRLNTPVSVFGHQSDHIAFAGDGVVAVLDLADPRVLARELQLETGIDTPEKALFGREARATEVTGPDGAPGWVETAVINVSNVDSHPGKTLAGCSYSLDPPAPAEEADVPPTVAAPSPGAAQPR